MTRRRRERWLLIRVAAQNVSRRGLHTILLGVAVMLGVGVGFASFVTGWGIARRHGSAVCRAWAQILSSYPERRW